MRLTVSSALQRIFREEDCLKIADGKALKNESFAFQIYVQASEPFCLPVRVESDLKVNVYSVKKMKGDCYSFYGDRTPDDYEARAEDNLYPELLRKCSCVCADEDCAATLFIEVPADEKPVGVHDITVFVGEEKVTLPLTVLDQTLEETDLIITHWFHMDGIADYYGVKAFSPEFYEKFESFLAAYKKLGNTMLLVPIFTPPLDTQVGMTRRTAQLVSVKKEGDRYSFDFTEMEKYIRLAKKYGVKYFEISHLFTQWGGECCPNIIVNENGRDSNCFGWSVSAESEAYKSFLTQFLPLLMEELERLGVKENTFLHLTDEPGEPHIERYERLSAFVKKLCPGVPTVDALSHYEFVKNGAVDMPVVATLSTDLEKFDGREYMLYYCQSVDENYLSNRYFHHPLQRTAVLGYQLYAMGVKGFLHWGFNFYNSLESKWRIDPYKSSTAGGFFPAGDAFIVYPGEEGVEYSIRYFALLKGFEEERLLKTLEKKLGKEKTKKLLEDEGVKGVHEYPRSASWHEEFRLKIYELLA